MNVNKNRPTKTGPQRVCPYAHEGTILDIEYLNCILAITRGKGMIKTTEELHVPQSSLSQYLPRLEQEIKDPLLIWAKGELLLTPAGELYVEATRKMIRIQKDLY